MVPDAVSNFFGKDGRLCTRLVSGTGAIVNQTDFSALMPGFEAKYRRYSGMYSRIDLIR